MHKIWVLEEEQSTVTRSLHQQLGDGSGSHVGILTRNRGGDRPGQTGKQLGRSVTRPVPLLQ